MIINLWAAGDLQAADEAVRTAAGRWPDQRQVWRTRIAYLMYSGRASEALASLEDKSSRPMAVLPDALATVTATARALAGQTGPTEAIAANLRFARANPERALTVAQAVAALGDADETFRLLDGYYFAQGDWSSLAPAGGDADRQSTPLFMPPMRPLWRDSRFAGLLERTGLEAYWRESGTRPDFRTTG